MANGIIGTGSPKNNASQYQSLLTMLACTHNTNTAFAFSPLLSSPLFSLLLLLSLSLVRARGAQALAREEPQTEEVHHRHCDVTLCLRILSSPPGAHLPWLPTMVRLLLQLFPVLSISHCAFPCVLVSSSRVCGVLSWSLWRSGVRWWRENLENER